MPNGEKPVLNDWHAVPNRLLTDPEWLKLSDAACALWSSARMWISREFTDGFIPDYALAVIRGGARKATVRELAASPFWEPEKGGHRDALWNAHNAPAQERIAALEYAKECGEYGSHVRYHDKGGAFDATCKWCQGAPSPSRNKVPDGSPPSSPPSRDPYSPGHSSGDSTGHRTQIRGHLSTEGDPDLGLGKQTAALTEGVAHSGTDARAKGAATCESCDRPAVPGSRWCDTHEGGF